MNLLRWGLQWVEGSSPPWLTHLNSWRAHAPMFFGAHAMSAAPKATTKTRRMPDIADYMTTEEAAEKLGFHVISIRRLVRDGKLKGVKVGPTWLVSRKSVDEYLKSTDGMSKTDPRRGQ